MKVFLDTWAWLTLRDRREANHQKITSLLNQFRSNRDALYTTDYILVETYTFFFSRLPVTLAQASINFVEESITGGFINLMWMTPERFERTKQLRLKYIDKPRISFTDLSSMAVMTELGIQTILTGDDHFNQVGLGFQVMP